MVGEGLSIPPVFSFGRISRHSAVNLGGWTRGATGSLVLIVWLLLVLSSLSFVPRDSFSFLQLFSSTTRGREKKYLRLRISPFPLVLSVFQKISTNKKTNRFVEDSFHALERRKRSGKFCNPIFHLDPSKSFKKSETNDRSDFFPPSKSRPPPEWNNLAYEYTRKPKMGKWAGTRYTGAGNNEDNTNPFVPPSFPPPLPLPPKTMGATVK